MFGTMAGYADSMRYIEELHRDAAQARLVHEIRDARRAEHDGRGSHGLGGAITRLGRRAPARATADAC